MRANTQLVPNIPLLPLKLELDIELPTEWRNKQEKIVIAISQRRNIITVYKGT